MSAFPTFLFASAPPSLAPVHIAVCLPHYHPPTPPVSGHAGDNFVLKSDNNIRVTSKAVKMSKSRGNVVNPDDIISGTGADALRLYLMFMGPLEQVSLKKL